MRRWPKNFDRFYTMARELKLSCPKGRALYACNRKACGGMPWNYEQGFQTHEFVMTHAKLSTAQRWLQHWMAGGSIRCLKRTEEEQRAYRRTCHKRRGY